MNPILRKTLDYCFAVLCKHCGKKVLDSDKEKKQKYLEDTCPTCGKNGRDPIETPEESEEPVEAEEVEETPNATN